MNKSDKCIYDFTPSLNHDNLVICIIIARTQLLVDREIPPFVSEIDIVIVSSVKMGLQCYHNILQ